MMDDDDAFLYGSDTENKDTNKNNQSNIDSNTTETTVNDSNIIKDVNNLSNESNNNNNNNNMVDKDSQMNEKAEVNNASEDSESDSESDSDVEFIIGSVESKISNVPAKQLENGNLMQVNSLSSTIPNSIKITTVPILTTTNGLDIEKVGLYNNIPITELSLDELKDKPWRLPGADISDYFNFGFDEISWRAYCAKNEKLRNDFNPGKLITELLASGSIPPTLGQMLPNLPPNLNGSNSTTPSIPPPFMMGMPGMPMSGVPGFMGMPNMPGMSNMPNMPGMPNMPNMPGMPNMPNMQGMPMSNLPNMPSSIPSTTNTPLATPVSTNVSTATTTNMTNNNNTNSPKIPNIPNIPNLNSRIASNTPEPINSKLPHIPSTLRDARDQADKDIEKGVTNQKFKDRERANNKPANQSTNRRRR